MAAAFPDLVAFLKDVFLFSGLSDSGLLRLAYASRVEHLPRDCILFHKDDTTDFAGVVRCGSVALRLATADGRELVVEELRAGDSFGELALATGQPQAFDAITREASDIVLIPRSQFLLELDCEPRMIRHLLELLAQRTRASSERESALAFLDAHARLARILLKMDHEASAIGYVTMSQEELGQYVGIARQTAARILGQWRRCGWILTGRGRIVLLNRPALRRYVEEVQL